jgi:hypothetical protein
MRQSLLFLSILLIVEIFYVSSRELIVNIKKQAIFRTSENLLPLEIEGLEDVEVDDIFLKLVLSEEKPLLRNKQYFLKRKEGTKQLAVQFSLRQNWPSKLEEEVVSITEIRIRGKETSSPNFLPVPIQFTRLLEMPHFIPNYKDLYLYENAPELRIHFSSAATLKEWNLIFDPPLVKNVDYDDVTTSSSEDNGLLFKLRPGKKWRKDPGPLKIVGMETEVGKVELDSPDGVICSAILPAVEKDSQQITDVNIWNAFRQLFQKQTRKLFINGKGFVPDMEFIFNVPLQKDIDYDFIYQSSSAVLIQLKEGKEWPIPPINNQLVVLNIKINGILYSLPDIATRVAVIYPDPILYESTTQQLYFSQSKQLIISGKNIFDVHLLPLFNFMDDYSFKFEVDPYSSSTNEVIINTPKDGNWLGKDFDNSFVKKKGSVDLKIREYRMGLISFPIDPPITIAKIIPDIDGIVCDNSCEFANDGVCDDSNLNPNYPRADYGQYNLVRDLSYCTEGTDCTDCGGPDAIVAFLSNSIVDDDGGDDDISDDYLSKLPENDDDDDDDLNIPIPPCAVVDDDDSHSSPSFGGVASDSSSTSTESPVSIPFFLGIMVIWNIVLFAYLYRKWVQSTAT